MNQNVKRNFKMRKSKLSLYLYILSGWILFGFCKELQAEEVLDFTQGRWDLGRHSTATFNFAASSAKGRIYATRNLFDSNRLTVWMTESSPEPDWVLVDFGEKRLMNRIELDFPTWAQDLELSYEIQVMIWGEWTTLLSKTDPKKTDSHTFKGMDASMIRIFFPKVKPMSVAMCDLRIYLGESLLTGTDKRMTQNRFPVRHGIIPENDFHLPGAPRLYRNGYHKGIDIYEREDIPSGRKIPLTQDTEVLSIQKGKIIRLDRDYSPMSLEEYERQKELTRKYPVTFVDRDFGGRQVWIDHGNGIVSAYNHLSAIRSDLRVGDFVRKGEVIGKAGNSGLRQEAEGSQENIHLHLEIWVDGEYLGKGLTPLQSREILQIFFSR